MNAQPTYPATSGRHMLHVPGYCPSRPDTRYPGQIKPGTYAVNDVVAMLRRFKHNPDAIQFIADMLEE